MQFRRSLYVTQDLEEGDVLTHENIRAIRPGFGLAPVELENLLGARVKVAVAKGTAVDWKLVLGRGEDQPL